MFACLFICLLAFVYLLVCLFSCLLVCLHGLFIGLTVSSFSFTFLTPRVCVSDCETFQEVIADANERKAVLDDSQEDRAAELSDEFADFIDKLNEAKERLESVEEEEEVEPSRLDDVDKRLCEIEKALETFQDVDELPGTQIEGERERVQVRLAFVFLVMHLTVH